MTPSQIAIQAMAEKIKVMNFMDTTHVQRVDAVRKAAASQGELLTLGTARSYIMFLEYILGHRH